MYKYSIKNMPQKVCIRKKWPIFIIYLKWDRILMKKYQGVQQMLNWPSRGHTDPGLFSDCQTVFIWLSVVCKAREIQTSLPKNLLQKNHYKQTQQLIRRKYILLCRKKAVQAKNTRSRRGVQKF